MCELLHVAKDELRLPNNQETETLTVFEVQFIVKFHVIGCKDGQLLRHFSLLNLQIHVVLSTELI